VFDIKTDISSLRREATEGSRKKLCFFLFQQEKNFSPEQRNIFSFVYPSVIRPVRGDRGIEL
jgi:hypothetical protein